MFTSFLRLFCVMMLFFLLLFVLGVSPNLRFGSPAFLLGSFPPGLCGGSTTANSYSKSRSGPKNSDKSEGAMVFSEGCTDDIDSTWCRISSQRKPIHFSNMLSTPESLGVWFLLTRRWKSIGKLQRPQEFPESEVTDLVTPPKCPQVDNSSFRKVICLQSSDFESEVQRASSCWRLLLDLCQVAPPIFWGIRSVRIFLWKIPSMNQDVHSRKLTWQLEWRCMLVNSGGVSPHKKSWFSLTN